MTDSSTDPAGPRVPGLAQIVEGALFAAGGPLTLEQMQALFEEDERPGRDALLAAIGRLTEDYGGRAVEVAQVAGGYRIQVRASVAPWVARLWDEKPVRYSRALLETLALIAYRQPITRGEIEDIRGVVVSTQIVKTLVEREWIRVVGHRDVPGRPALYATTRRFLDYFGLRSLNDLPPLSEIRDPEFLGDELDLEDPDPSSAKEPDEVSARESDRQPLDQSARNGSSVDDVSLENSGARPRDADETPR